MRIFIWSAVYTCFIFFVLVQPDKALGATGSLLITPPYPEPNNDFVVTLPGNMIITNGTIRWFVDGTEIADAHNKKDLSLTAPSAGSSKNISALVETSTGKIEELRHIVTPLRIDLIISADTYTPDFYNGRSLPSNAGIITARAFVFTDIQKPVKDYSYTWKIGGEKRNKDLTGKSNALTFNANFESKIGVEVGILDKNGVQVGQASVIVPIQEPEIYFYEVNPLRGLLPEALTNNYLIGDEITLKAEPYYVEKNSAVLATSWKINRTKAQNNENPFEITLKKSKGTGSALISFELFNTNKLLQSTQSTLRLTY